MNVFARSGLLCTAVAVEASVQIISSLAIRPCDICLSIGIQSFQRIGLMQAVSGILSKAISFPVMIASGSSAVIVSMACGAGAAGVVTSTSTPAYTIMHPGSFLHLSGGFLVDASWANGHNR
jgi:spore maturation protein SpmB